MKRPITIFTGLFLALFSHAQNVKTNPVETRKFDHHANIKTDRNSPHFDSHGNKMKVLLLKDSLFVADKDRLVPIADLQSLDTIIKKLPQPGTLVIEFESRNAGPEKIRAVDAVLKQCRCQIIRHSISFDNNRRL